MSGQYGVSEIGKILVTVIELGEVVAEMIEHKKAGGSTITMLGKVINLGDEIFDLFKLDVNLLKKQIGELNNEDFQDLKAIFIEKFELEDKAAEAKVEAGVELLDKLGQVIVETIKFAKEFKK